MKMDYRRQKTVAVAIGGVFLASLLVNLIRIFWNNPRHFIATFTISGEVGLPWIPYISILVILCSILGAAGLLKYKRWGFYAIYLTYLLGTLVVWFPFFPTFLFQFTSGMYWSVITLTVVYGVLVVLIYLHVSGKKRGCFGKSAAA
jgi:hypothetical protein